MRVFIERSLAAGFPVSGRAIVATTPWGRFLDNERRPDSPCIAARRARTLAKPVPRPEVWVKPRPESETRTRNSRS